jgi:hypothetical protein
VSDDKQIDRYNYEAEKENEGTVNVLMVNAFGLGVSRQDKTRLESEGASILWISSTPDPDLTLVRALPPRRAKGKPPVML